MRKIVGPAPEYAYILVLTPQEYYELFDSLPHEGKTTHWEDWEDYHAICD